MQQGKQSHKTLSGTFEYLLVQPSVVSQQPKMLATTTLIHAISKPDYAS